MSVATVVVSLAVTTAAVYLVQDRAGVSDASTLYLLAVAVVAYMRGSWAAIGAAIGAFLTYNFLFLPPRFTFVVSDPQHILTLILLLMVGGGIGWLNGLQRDQALRSSRREHEARALFGVSRAIASAKRMTDALPVLVAALATDARMARVWIGLGATWAQEQVVATSDPMANAPVSGPHSVRRPGADASQPAWVRLSPPGPPQWHRDNLSLFRLELTDGETTLGSLWAARDPTSDLRPLRRRDSYPPRQTRSGRGSSVIAFRSRPRSSRLPGAAKSSKRHCWTLSPTTFVRHSPRSEQPLARSPTRTSTCRETNNARWLVRSTPRRIGSRCS